MFTVKWIKQGQENEPVESERFGVINAETVISACRFRMPAMRVKYPKAPPDGFVVVDDQGAELGRWFEQPRS
jgi:hypothetical protein